MVKPVPKVIIFDVDGVLVDVRDSFHRCTVDVVRHFTGRRVRRSEIHAWKNRSRFNDDWRLTTDWIASLGRPVPYEEVKRKYMELYWGTDGNGYVRRERWVVPRNTLARLSRRACLAVFTGRTRRELEHTLARFHTRKYFQMTVTFDDINGSKPDPEGLLRILGRRMPSSALYLGDNIDDALAARRAGIAFLGVLPRGTAARKTRGTKLLEAGALGLLSHATELERWLQ